MSMSANANLDFRALLVKIQELLSDGDRQRLHFLFGEDVPRHLREDPSINGSLRVLESLLDKAIITEEDCDYLIKAFQKINCDNAAQRLREYHQYRLHGPPPPTTKTLHSILFEKEAEDKFNTKILSNFSVSPFEAVTCLPPLEILDKHQSKEVSSSKQNTLLWWKFSSWCSQFMLQKSITIKEFLALFIISLTSLAFVMFLILWKNQLPSDSKSPSPPPPFKICSDYSKVEDGKTILWSAPSETERRLTYGGLVIDSHNALWITNTADDSIEKWTCANGCFHQRFSISDNNKETLNIPSSIAIDRIRNNTLIVCDRMNKRVVRLSAFNSTYQETIIDNIACWGVAVDEQGSIFVSDTQNHSIYRYKIEDSIPLRVAGTGQMGNDLDQLNTPTFIFLQTNESVYISDSKNHRVMKWFIGSKKGILVAGGQEGNETTQLSFPQGLYVDDHGTIYIADFNNHRIMRWCHGARKGSIIIGEDGPGNRLSQLNYPTDLKLDMNHYLYVADSGNYRIQQYKLNIVE